MIKYEEVYKLLLESDSFDDDQYNKLVNVYGVRLVNGIIKKIVRDNGNNFNKYSKYVLDLSRNEEIDESLSLYQYYISDVSLIEEIDDLEKEKLLKELIDIVNRLNILFDVAKCDDDMFGKNRKPWICDKVGYCIECCDDLELLDEIKKLYSLYVDKRNIFLNGYLKFVISIASDYVRDDILSLVDFIQYGNMGLIRAIENFDLKFNTKFITYAYDWINQSIRYNMKKNMYQIRKPGHMFELNSKKIKAYNILLCELEREPSNREIAEYMGITLDEVKYLESVFLETRSLDEAMETMVDGVFATKLEHTIDDSVDVERDTINRCLSDELNECMMEYLTDRERFVLYSRYNMGMKYPEIGKILGVTYQRALQIHNEAIKKLGKKKKVRKMEGYIR